MPPSPAPDEMQEPVTDFLRRQDDSRLHALIAQQIAARGGWMGFDDFMRLALYQPGLGYYSGGKTVFGHWPDGKFGAADQGGDIGDGVAAAGGGSDFVTAPEMSPLFGQALARQVAQALHATGTDEVWEFGAGTGALALQILDALKDMGVAVKRYTIVDLSQPLMARQKATLQAHAATVHWAAELPPQMQGVVVGNEVLDAMPVKLLVRKGGAWHERGVACDPRSDAEQGCQLPAGPPQGELAPMGGSDPRSGGAWGCQLPAGPPQGELAPTGGSDPRSGGAWGCQFIWQDRATALRPPLEIPGEHDYLTEIHPQGEAFVATLADRLEAGAIFLIDYGFPEAEYYHPQRHMGTVMCHHAHRADADPLVLVGQKDITAHVNFTGIAVAAQNAGLEVLGYTNQAHFLINCGLVDAMQAADLPQRVAAQKLILEHEMGEFFKVIGLTKGPHWEALGFVLGDKTHRL